ncbi:MAG: cupin [Gammaproteobacteria bacterium]|nr:MAG: cupin [Gammaproteobacteria bacterium]
MSALKVFADTDPSEALLETDAHDEIAEVLEGIGVRFEQWQANAPIAAGDAPEKVLAAYQADIERLKKEEGYITVDVVSLNADHPDKVALRQKFLSEHTHGEDEVRFFVAGHGLFSLHVGKRVYEVLCEAGDLISVPAKTTHWFDMGPNPHFVAIRLFNNPEGWVAQYTGDEIASRFSRLEN